MVQPRREESGGNLTAVFNEQKKGNNGEASQTLLISAQLKENKQQTQVAITFKLNIRGKNVHNDRGEALMQVNKNGHTISILGDFQTFTQEGPKKPDLTLVQLRVGFGLGGL